MNGSGGQPEKQVPELYPTVIKFRNGGKTAYPRMVNQLLRFPPTSEHNDAPDTREGAGSTCEIFGTRGSQAVSGGREGIE